MTVQWFRVAVPVAGGWRSPNAPRDIDAPALGADPDIRGWLDGMTADDKRGLVGRLETQVLLGETVIHEETLDEWAHVAIPDQPATSGGAPYRCWVPLAQLAPADSAPTTTGVTATVLAPVAPLDAGSGSVDLSFGTALPHLGDDDGRVAVALPDGRTGWLGRGDVAIHDHASPALQATAASVTSTLQSFVGLPYLWAGRSGFGFDCSGLVQLVHRVHGITLPRDTGPMSAAGEPVDAAGRQPGDLVFFERNGDVHHVVTWLGDGLVVESPKTGLPVRVIELDALPYAAEVTVTRRVLR
ncbi:MAG TPA: C40 family peptidase [Candidatus Limnocylindria bacterium]|nr:C40 family peptidase [Candidatus Limnocylindria bacterium]